MEKVLDDERPPNTIQGRSQVFIGFYEFYGLQRALWFLF